MVRGENCHGRFGIALVEVHERQEKAWARFLVVGLYDDAACEIASELPYHFGIPEMGLADHGKEPLRRNQFPRPAESMLEHGALADDVDVLLGYRIAAQSLDKRL